MAGQAADDDIENLDDCYTPIIAYTRIYPTPIDAEKTSFRTNPVTK